MKTIRELIVRMATDNAGWGCLRIRGELKKVGHRVAKTTIATTLKNNGISPSPDRPTTWNKMQEVRWFVALSGTLLFAGVWLLLYGLAVSRRRAVVEVDAKETRRNSHRWVLRQAAVSLAARARPRRRSRRWLRPRAESDHDAPTHPCTSRTTLAHPELAPSPAPSPAQRTAARAHESPAARA